MITGHACPCRVSSCTVAPLVTLYPYPPKYLIFLCGEFSLYSVTIPCLLGIFPFRTTRIEEQKGGQSELLVAPMPALNSGNSTPIMFTFLSLGKSREQGLHPLLRWRKRVRCQLMSGQVKAGPGFYPYASRKHRGKPTQNSPVEKPIFLWHLVNSILK